jgi:hypothetical protein
MRSLFRFAPLHAGDLALTALAIAAVVGLFAAVARLPGGREPMQPAAS